MNKYVDFVDYKPALKLKPTLMMGKQADGRVIIFNTETGEKIYLEEPKTTPADSDG